MPIHKEEKILWPEVGEKKIKELVMEMEQAIVTQQEFIDEHQQIDFEDYVRSIN